MDINIHYPGWIYTVNVKTQAVLPAQTNLRGKIYLSIQGENASLNDSLLASGRLMHGLFHPGGEATIELKSDQRLGEVSDLFFSFLFSFISNRFNLLN